MGHGCSLVRDLGVPELGIRDRESSIVPRFLLPVSMEGGKRTVNIQRITFQLTNEPVRLTITAEDSRRLDRAWPNTKAFDMRKRSVYCSYICRSTSAIPSSNGRNLSGMPRKRGATSACIVSASPRLPGYFLTDTVLKTRTLARIMAKSAS